MEVKLAPSGVEEVIRPFSRQDVHVSRHGYQLSTLYRAAEYFPENQIRCDL